MSIKQFILACAEDEMPREWVMDAVRRNPSPCRA